MPTKKTTTKQKLKEVSAPSQLLLDAYTLVRNDFLINHFPSMSGGDRVARKNVNWFLMYRVEDLTDEVEQHFKAQETLK